MAEKSKSKTSNSSSAAWPCYNVDIINTTRYTQKSVLTGSFTHWASIITMYISSTFL